MGFATWALRDAQVDVEAKQSRDLVNETLQLDYSINQWQARQSEYLQFLIVDSQLDHNDKASVHRILELAHRLIPAYSFFYFSEDGFISESVGPMVADPRNDRALGAIRAQLQRPSSYQINSHSQLLIPATGSPCIATTVALKAANPGTQGRGTGFLGSCLPLTDFGLIGGVENVISTTSMGNAPMPVIDFDDPRGGTRGSRGLAALMVFPNGSFIELDVNQKRVDQMAHLNALANRSSRWQPLITAILRAKSPSQQFTVYVDGMAYCVSVVTNKNGLRSVLLVDRDSALVFLHQLYKTLVIALLIHLFIVSVLIYLICRRLLSRPIELVGGKLQSISRGEFGEPLPEQNNDLGRLFGYVNQASKQLKIYLAESNHHAALDAQLVEARRIQADFLLKDLPCTDQLDIATIYKPAYEIGADWYDAILIDGLTFLVVADVCDKGIPSALYMSVFRSLLRLALGQEWEVSRNPQQTLVRALDAVNQYMVANHGSTGMFATVFVAVVDPQQDQLHYILAGHEQPLLIHGHQLSQLQLGGPAVGIFADCPFQVHHSPFTVGDVLLAFTDGLPDSRNPAGEGFGHQRIVEVLGERQSCDWTPSQLLEQICQSLDGYCNGTDQFDDLTLLSIQAR